MFFPKHYTSSLPENGMENICGNPVTVPATLCRETALKLSSCMQSVPKISVKSAFCTAGYVLLAEDSVEVQEK